MKVIMLFIASTVLFLVFIFHIGNEFARYQCNNFASITGKETRYANFDMCYINTSKGFQRWDEYKMRAAASEGLATRVPWRVK